MSYKVEHRPIQITIDIEVLCERAGISRPLAMATATVEAVHALTAVATAYVPPWQPQHSGREFTLMGTAPAWIYLVVAVALRYHADVLVYAGPEGTVPIW